MYAFRSFKICIDSVWYLLHWKNKMMPLYWMSRCTSQFSSVAQLCPTLCDSMEHQLLELAQTHVHRVGDAIQPSHPLLSPSPPIFNLSQHQGLFQWVGSLHHVAKVLEFQLQHQSFQWIFRTDFLQDRLVSSPCSLWASQESSLTPQFKKHQFFGAQLSF